jgi:hypothetical protein
MEDLMSRKAGQTRRATEYDLEHQQLAAKRARLNTERDPKINARYTRNLDENILILTTELHGGKPELPSEEKSAPRVTNGTNASHKAKGA